MSLWAILSGTIQARRIADPSEVRAGEVLFDGTLPYDGEEYIAIWDAGLNNIRAMTVQERANRQRAQRRAAILDALTDANHANASRDKALALTLLDAYLLLAGRINALLTAIDNGATFAQAKASVALIADCPLYTGADLLLLLRNHVNAGDVD